MKLAAFFLVLLIGCGASEKPQAELPEPVGLELIARHEAYDPWPGLRKLPTPTSLDFDELLRGRIYFSGTIEDLYRKDLGLWAEFLCSYGAPADVRFRLSCTADQLAALRGLLRQGQVLVAVVAKVQGAGKIDQGTALAQGALVDFEARPMPKTLREKDSAGADAY